MARYFTHYWSNRTWNQQKKHSSENDLLEHIAGNSFGKREIDIGDGIYVITVIKGKLYLYGMLIVGKICDADEAAEYLKCKAEDLWEADEHILASAATYTNLSFEVPLEVTKKLRFKSGNDLKPLLFSSPNCLDQQTLRGVRELDSNSASELDKLLPSPIELLNPILPHYQHPLLGDIEYLELSEKQREALLKVRVGQEYFRDALVNYWGECAVTRCKEISLLRASHIKPWSKCDSKEAIDPFNGFLLSPTLDAAFDVGFITFDDTGKVMLSNCLKKSDAEILGISSSLCLSRIEQQHRHYLRYHRDHIFRKS